MKRPLTNYELGLDIALKPDQWKKLNAVKDDIRKSTGQATGGLVFLGGTLLVLSAVLYKKGRRG